MADVLIAAEQCSVLLEALMEYAGRQTKKIEHKLSVSLSKILPKSVYRLLASLNDTSWRPGGFIWSGSIRTEYIHTLATQMALIDFTDNLD